MPSSRSEPPAFDPSVSPFHVLTMPLVVEPATIASSADCLRGRQVFLQQDRRHAEHIADVVKAIAHVVRREVIGWMKVDADEIANRVVVFRAIEPANRHSPWIERATTIIRFQAGLDPLRQLREFLTRGLGAIVRRHQPTFDIFLDPLPHLALGPLRISRPGRTQGSDRLSALMLRDIPHSTSSEQAAPPRETKLWLVNARPAPLRFEESWASAFPVRARMAPGQYTQDQNETSLRSHGSSRSTYGRRMQSPNLTTESLASRPRVNRCNRPGRWAMAGCFQYTASACPSLLV